MLAPNTGKLANGIAGAVGWVATKLGQGHRSVGTRRELLAFKPMDAARLWLALFGVSLLSVGRRKM